MTPNKLNIIKELLNNYSKNFNGEEFDNDLSEVRKDGKYHLVSETNEAISVPRYMIKTLT